MGGVQPRHQPDSVNFTSHLHLGRASTDNKSQRSCCQLRVMQTLSSCSQTELFMLSRLRPYRLLRSFFPYFPFCGILTAFPFLFPVPCPENPAGSRCYLPRPHIESHSGNCRAQLDTQSSILPFYRARALQTHHAFSHRRGCFGKQSSSD